MTERDFESSDAPALVSSEARDSAREEPPFVKYMIALKPEDFTLKNLKAFYQESSPRTLKDQDIVAQLRTDLNKFSICFCPR